MRVQHILFISLHVYIYIHIWAHIHIYHICMFMYICAYMYIHTHIMIRFLAPSSIVVLELGQGLSYPRQCWAQDLYTGPETAGQEVPDPTSEVPILQGPHKMPVFWWHIPHVAVVSHASNIRQEDTGCYLGL